jgi:hypothetical protein
MKAVPSLLRSVLARTSVRMRAQRGLEWGAGAVTVAAGFGAAYGLVARPDKRVALALLGGVAATCAAALLRRIRPEAVARTIDQRAGLAGRVSAALEFAAIAAHERTPFMEAALRDAEARASSVRPRDVAPFVRPRAGWFALGALALWAVSTHFSAQPTSRPVPRSAPSAAASRTPVALGGELRAFERTAERLAREAQGGELAPELARYQSLLRALASGQITSEQALGELFALEDALGAAGRGGSERALVEALARELARVRSASGQPGSVGTPARTALHELASSLESGALDAKEREALARALARVRALREQSARAEDEGVLHKKSGTSPASASQEQRVLEDKRRELEQLRRERAQTTPARRALERLQRELEQARAALARNEPREAGEALARGADALSQHENSRALQRELEQLREQLQREQSGASSTQERAQTPGAQPPGAQPSDRPNGAPEQGGATEGSLEQRRERFRLRALGEPSAPGAGDGGTLALAPGSEGAGDGGASASTRAHTGEPSPQTGADMLMPGGTGAELLVPQALQSASAGGSDEHDPRRGAPSPRRNGAYEDRALEGARARGPTRSQVIRGAARGGFATAAYRRVYGDYRAHAEQWIERDDVPPGYRYFVRRYFQLVRPREGEEAQ